LKTRYYNEFDVVISSGEQVTAGALSGLLNSLGIKAQSRLGWQIPIVTSGDHKSARIEAIHSKELINLLELNEVIVIPGFQGINSEGRITTLGRGGSDTSAVAIAAAIDADCCDIYTDVDGVYTSNVLEHIEDDVHTLQQIRSVMKPQSNLVVYVPAFQCLYSSWDNSDGHHRRYNKKELLFKLDAAGFDVTKVIYVDTLGFFASLAARIFRYKKSTEVTDGKIANYHLLLR
jgi:hypothetical protein